MTGDESGKMESAANDFAKFKQNSAVNLTAMADPRNHALEDLHTRSYSFSNFMKFRSDKKSSKPLKVSDVHEDCDRLSMFSDSGMSDISQATDASINSVVSTGVTPNSPSMRRNFSTNDVTMYRTHNMMNSNHEVDSKDLKTPYKLPNIMLWNWLSNQTHCIPEAYSSEHSQIKPDINEYLAVQAEKKVKSRLSMRDLNAFAPNGW